MSHYTRRDPMSLEPHYSAHVSAMTTEGLHAKSAIAAELAFRDALVLAERERTLREIEAYVFPAGDETSVTVSVVRAAIHLARISE